MNLAQAAVRERVTVADLTMEDRERRRLVELGVRRGAVVEVVRRAPWGSPLALRVGGGLLALRSDTARHVQVTRAQATRSGGGEDD